MRAWWTRVGVGAAVLAALALGRVVTDALPLDRSADDPFIRSGEFGQTVSLRYADVTVDDVRMSRSLSSASTGILAGGRFLLVDLRIVAKGEPVFPLGLVLRDARGREYAPSSRASCTFGTAPTGLTWYATACFDVPEDAVAGAVLEFGLLDPLIESRRDDVARIDLGISTEEASELWATEDQVRSPQGALTPPPTDILTPAPEEAP